MYVTVNNRPIQDYVHQDDHTQTYLCNDSSTFHNNTIYYE